MTEKAPKPLSTDCASKDGSHLPECDGDPSPSCLSSLSEFRHRAVECLMGWRSILCW